MNFEYIINAKNKKTGEKLKCLIKLTPCNKFKIKFSKGKTLEITLGYTRATEIASKITMWYLKEENIEIIRNELKEILTPAEKYATKNYINVSTTIMDNKTYLLKNKK